MPTIKDVMEKLEGVVTKMDKGFKTNKDTLDNLSTIVKDLSENLELAHGLIKDIQSELQQERV